VKKQSQRREREKLKKKLRNQSNKDNDNRLHDVRMFSKGQNWPRFIQNL